MREIKFRAWDKSSKKMGMVQIRQMLIPDGNNEHDNQELAVSHLKSGTNPSHWLIAPILMQYTGLKDKNGKEIYEGDIYKQLWEETEVVGTILYYINSFWISPSTNYYIGSIKFTGEVIGNIYENPELLMGV